MKDTKITDSILYVGVDDKDLDLFESQYVVPNGVSYNSYAVSYTHLGWNGCGGGCIQRKCYGCGNA